MDTQDRHEVTSKMTSYVGIDVSKARLDVAVRPSGQAWQSSNDETGIAAVVERLQALAPHLIVLEATGGLERLVATALALAGLSVAVVNPRQVRDFAKATGRLAKTDAVDAAVLAHFAQALQPTAHPLPDADSQALSALVERRRQLVNMLTAEKNRLQQALPAVHTKIAAHIAWLEQALADVDGELDQMLRASPVWRERDQRLAQRAGSRLHRLTGLAGTSARVRHWTGQAFGDAGGTGSAQPRQWCLARQSCDLGRSPAGPDCPLYGHAGGRAPQSHPAGLLRTIAGTRQTQEGRPHRMYAQIADHPACRAPHAYPVGT
jgi:hypothetical protein